MIATFKLKEAEDCFCEIFPPDRNLSYMPLPACRMSLITGLCFLQCLFVVCFVSRITKKLKKYYTEQISSKPTSTFGADPDEGTDPGLFSLMLRCERCFVLAEEREVNKTET